MAPRQLSLIAPNETDLVIDVAGDHGEVFTRRWVVEMILDLAGYTTDVDLAVLRVVEPSCGVGAFLVPMVERLIASAEAHGRNLADHRAAIRAFDLLAPNVELSRKAVAFLLEESGLEANDAASTATSWISQADFCFTTPMTSRT